MSLLNLTAASRVAGVGRSTIVRALKSGRLSATTNEQGERVIDTSELARVFGPLKGNDYPHEQAEKQPLQAMDSHDSDMVSLLREQLAAALDREKQAIEQGRERETRLLTMLEVEQATRRELETKLLPSPPKPSPPKPSPPKRSKPWFLLILLAAVLIFAGWYWWDSIKAIVMTP